MGEKILDRFSLKGKTALVTGGAQGIGRGYAFALGEAGAKVAIVDINPDTAAATVKDLEAAGIEAMACACDVTDPDQVIAMVKSVVEAWGKLTIGVNNAGMGIWSDALTMPFAMWKKTMSLNMDGIFLCAREEAKYMIKEGYGKIINTASMSAHISNTPQNQVAYNASKAGVLHMTRSLAAEWAPFGVRVNSISPGYTKTELVEKLLSSPEGKKMEPEWIRLIPQKRMASVEDLQGACLYLACKASDYATGSDIIVDGGYCCW
ncbi:glucose 1-dehydrogenase [uncultured Sphaerochaeta sp.]|uniref:SDR family NAD(P)-dependent oxidoreductase n=1 Tax=uncultured Sphaerochaeta sp. TaxID=886478 RepID=UPI002A0A9569|nr:glucose 1-dehydrogenase [uncultured Sphaerochaeta sp.]